MDAMEGRDEMDVAPDGSTRIQRACDSCRSRKIRCDRAIPCSNCRASKLTCQTTAPSQKAQRQRVHISDEYEKKIDRIEDRLAGIENVLEKLATKLSNLDIQRDNTERSSQSRSSKIGRSPNSSNEPPGTTPALFEGETTMTTQSEFARELLEKAVGSTPSISQNSEIKATLDSLQHLVNRQNVYASVPNEPQPFFSKDLAAIDASKLERPPMSAVGHVLEKAATTPTMCFAVIMPFLKISDFRETVKEAFETPESCPPCRRILVYGILYHLFSEFAFYPVIGSRTPGFTQHAQQSKTQMETAMSQLDLLVPATWENIMGLIIAASYAVELAKPSLCWVMNSLAISLATTLGYHRIATMKDDTLEERSAKLHAFWFIYTLDKMLSLRLGRASMIQDWDMSLPFTIPVEPGKLPPIQRGTKMHIYWIKVAQIQGRIYEQLFSPASFLKPHSERANTAAELVNAMNLAWAERGSASVVDFLHNDFSMEENVPRRPSSPRHSQPPSQLPRAPIVYPTPSQVELGADPRSAMSKESTEAFMAFGDIFYHADAVIHYSTTSLIQRAMSPDNVSFNEECLKSARAALSAHQTCSKQYNTKGNEALWSGYVHWSVLQAPFTPFIVLFCNAITHCHHNDLYSLSQFVISLESCRTISEGADKLYRMCHLFLLVAKHYVEAKTREAEAHRSSADPVGFYGIDGAQLDLSGVNVNQQFDPYLSALGLGPNANTAWPMTAPYPPGSVDGYQSFDGSGIAIGQNTVQDWFSGSRYIMGLLEGDDINMPDLNMGGNLQN